MILHRSVSSDVVDVKFTKQIGSRLTLVAMLTVRASTATRVLTKLSIGDINLGSSGLPRVSSNEESLVCRQCSRFGNVISQVIETNVRGPRGLGSCIDLAEGTFCEA
jgi:hypothetical protein